MVMDVTPSPQCVGREFVRQYYTLLNEGPQFLHRFYSHNSSFIHGNEKFDDGEQEPIIGQTEIHKKIMSLNFHDCHAKIRYVDSQATVGTAVVVQVTGELSNNQEPLRRFMQTFVLAPQTPNKYYVHNDIFRYQDEVFNDSDEEDEIVEQEQNQPLTKQMMPQSEQVDSPELIENNHPQMMDFYQQQMGVSAVDHSQHQHQHVNGGTVPLPAEPALTNGHNEEQDSPLPPTPPSHAEQEVAPKEQTPVEPEPTPAAPEPAADLTPAQVDEPAAPVEDNKVKLWANLVGGSTSATVNSQRGTFHNQVPEHSLPSHAAPSDRVVHSTQRQQQHSMRNNRPSNTLPAPEQRGGIGDGFKPSRQDDGSGGEDRRPERLKYPDSQQVFVGGLPLSISEFELKNFFKSFGPVIEVRINRTSPHKQPFGFVVFDSEQNAKQVLTNKDLDYNGHSIHIEEKKTRGEGGRPQSNSRAGGRRDGPRHIRGSGNRGGFGGPSREDSGSRTEQGRYNNLNRPNNRR